MKESKNYCVHLSTGFYWLKSIETLESESVEKALYQAVVYAIKNDLAVDYVVDGSDKYNELVELYRTDDDDEHDTMEILERGAYMYMDLSEYGLPCIWLSMRDTKIDHTSFDNTVTMESEV